VAAADGGNGSADADADAEARANDERQRAAAASLPAPLFAWVGASARRPSEAAVALALGALDALDRRGLSLLWPLSCGAALWQSRTSLLPALAGTGGTAAGGAAAAALDVCACAGLALYGATRLLASADKVPRGGLVREAYNAALSNVAGADAGAGAAGSSCAVCVTCEVVRPLRSKHCSRCGVCVAEFDHCCAWTGCCVGAANRGAFVLFVAAASAAAAAWVALLTVYLAHGREPARAPAWWPLRAAWLLLALQPLWMGSFGLYLLQGQARLIARGLTGNEARCWKRAAYAYLRDEAGRFRNPFARGGPSAACARFWLRAAGCGGGGDGERLRGEEATAARGGGAGKAAEAWAESAKSA
jgi:hypothetical protein